MDWKKTLGVVAPTIATALGGPLAGVAVRELGKAIGLGDAATEDDVAAAIAGATPETLAAAKKAEQEFLARMEELGVERARIAADDRASARAREIATRDPMVAFIALASLAGFFGILGALIFVEVPDNALSPLNIMLGVLGTLVAGLSNYYFGSSAGSARKNDMIERLKAGRE